MEKIADRLETILKNQIDLFEDLLELLEEEKEHLVKMDIDALWKTNARKKKISNDLTALHETVLQAVEKMSRDLKLGDNRLSLSGFIKKMPVPLPVRAALEQLRAALATSKENVANLAAANRGYINDYLAVINGIFSTVAATGNREQYKYDGSLLKHQGNKQYINAEV